MQKNLDQSLIDELVLNSDQQLIGIIQNDLEFSESVLLSDSRLSEYAGLEPFGKGWIGRFTKTILSDVSGKPLDQALSWSLTMTVLGVSEILVEKYDVNAAAYPAAVALAILLIKAARTETTVKNEKESSKED